MEKELQRIFNHMARVEGGSGMATQAERLQMNGDSLRDQPAIKLDLIAKALDRAGVAVGNEHETYPPWERVRYLAEQRDYFTRQCDQARAQLAAARDALEAARPVVKYRAATGDNSEYAEGVLAQIEEALKQ